MILKTAFSEDVFRNLGVTREDGTPDTSGESNILRTLLTNFPKEVTSYLKEYVQERQATNPQVNQQDPWNGFRDRKAFNDFLSQFVIPSLTRKGRESIRCDVGLVQKSRQGIQRSYGQGTDQDLIGKINAKKQEEFEKWINELSHEYSSSPAFQYIALSSIIKGSGKNNYNVAARLDEAVLAKAYEKYTNGENVQQTENGQKNLGFSSVWDNALSYVAADMAARIGQTEAVAKEFDKKWVKVDQLEHDVSYDAARGTSDSEIGQRNKQKIDLLMTYASGQTACVSQEGQATKYLTDGDVWVYFNGGLQVIFAMKGHNVGKEVRDGSNKPPLKSFDAIESFLASQKAKGNEINTGECYTYKELSRAVKINSLLSENASVEIPKFAEELKKYPYQFSLLKEPHSNNQTLVDAAAEGYVNDVLTASNSPYPYLPSIPDRFRRIPIVINAEVDFHLKLAARPTSKDTPAFRIKQLAQSVASGNYQLTDGQRTMIAGIAKQAIDAAIAAGRTPLQNTDLIQDLILLGIPEHEYAQFVNDTKNAALTTTLEGRNVTGDEIRKGIAFWYPRASSQDEQMKWLQMYAPHLDTGLYGISFEEASIQPMREMIVAAIIKKGVAWRYHLWGDKDFGKLLNTFSPVLDDERVRTFAKTLLPKMLAEETLGGWQKTEDLLAAIPRAESGFASAPDWIKNDGQAKAAFLQQVAQSKSAIAKRFIDIVKKSLEKINESGQYIQYDEQRSTRRDALDGPHAISSQSKALEEAKKCVDLAPEWIKQMPYINKLLTKCEELVQRGQFRWKTREQFPRVKNEPLDTYTEGKVQAYHKVLDALIAELQSGQPGELAEKRFPVPTKRTTAYSDPVLDPDILMPAKDKALYALRLAIMGGFGKLVLTAPAILKQDPSIAKLNDTFMAKRVEEALYNGDLETYQHSSPQIQTLLKDLYERVYYNVVRRDLSNGDVESFESAPPEIKQQLQTLYNRVSKGDGNTNWYGKMPKYRGM